MRYLAAVLLAALAVGQAPAPAPSTDARQNPVPVWRPELREQLHRDLETLQERLPLPVPVVLVFADLPDALWAYTVFDVTMLGYRIVMGEVTLEHATFARETLVHEFAHAMSTTSGRWDAHSHGAFWGIAYSQSYRALFSPEELNRLPDQPAVVKPEDD